MALKITGAICQLRLQTSNDAFEGVKTSGKEISKLIYVSSKEENVYFSFLGICERTRYLLNLTLNIQQDLRTLKHLNFIEYR